MKHDTQENMRSDGRNPKRFTAGNEEIGPSDRESHQQEKMEKTKK